ncbi:hypothetical protein DHD32_22250 [Arenibacter sp. TNZ]|nr:hypothetical protein [Arenibacter sp. TNZ]
MICAAVIIRGEPIVLGLFSFKVAPQNAAQAFGNLDRKRVARFILRNQTYKYLRYSLGINPKPLEVR